MKPFDLEKALAGEPVQTRNGQEVPQPHLFDVDGVEYPLVSVIGGEVTCWTEDGCYFSGPAESLYDLFMAPKKRLVHVNFYKNVCGYESYAHEDRAVAERNGGSDRIGGKSYPVEIEE